MPTHIPVQALATFGLGMLEFVANLEAKRAAASTAASTAAFQATTAHAQAALEAENEAARDERRRKRAESRRTELQRQQGELASSSETPGNVQVTTINIIVPPGYKAGDTMAVQLHDSSFDVVVPEGYGEGSVIAVEPPAETIEEEEIAAELIEEEEIAGTERLLVVVPEGVHPGETFNVRALWGGMFEVCCPDGLTAGESMEVELPVEPEFATQQPPAQPAESDGDKRAPDLPSVVGLLEDEDEEDSLDWSGVLVGGGGIEEDIDAEPLLDRAALKLRSLAILTSATEVLSAKSDGDVVSPGGESRSSDTRGGVSSSSTLLERHVQGEAGEGVRQAPELPSVVGLPEDEDEEDSSDWSGVLAGGGSIEEDVDAEPLLDRAALKLRSLAILTSATEVLMCRSIALREPHAEEGCRYYVGQGVQLLRSSGEWDEGTILEILRGFHILYRWRSRVSDLVQTARASMTILTFFGV